MENTAVATSIWIAVTTILMAKALISPTLDSALTLTAMERIETEVLTAAV